MRLQSATITVLILIAMAFGVNHSVAAQGTGLPAEMLDVEWSLISMQSAPGTVEDTTGKGLTIKFDASGLASGSAGCNTFRGGYTAGEGQTLTFSPLATTLMACAEQEIADRETAYLKALEGVGSYKLDGASLQLMSNSGQAILSYTKGQPTTLPQTGGDDYQAALLTMFGVLCCIAGLWMHRRRFAPSRVD